MITLKTFTPAFALTLLAGTIACMNEAGASGAMAMASAPVAPQEEALPAPPEPPVPPGTKTILLGLLHDTSNSMDGLISQA